MPWSTPFNAVPLLLPEKMLMALSDYISASGENTTYKLSAPATKSTSDFEAGRIQDDENPADSIDITADNYTELEWCIKALEAAQVSEAYQFRVTKKGVALDTYTVTPQLTIVSAGISMAIMMHHLRQQRISQ